MIRSRSSSSLVLCLLAALLALFALARPALAQPDGGSFGFDEVAARAAALAQKPWHAPAPVGPALAKLDYDAYRDIRFKPQRALWRDADLPFELMFFHAGGYFGHAVKLHEVADGAVRPLVVPREDFDFGRNKALAAGRGPAELAGFRVHYPLNKPQVKDEVVVFLGSSYFRAVGAGQHYGLSARGLAVDTVPATPGGREEFPSFTEFWIERPGREAKELVIHALLDGPHVTGAYRFVVKPGATTGVEVRAKVFQRKAGARLGFAPLTTMFFSGENQPVRDDFRPEVHDSDGLQVQTASGEWLWRPLTNPAHAFVSSFALSDPRGFGLMQRDRGFASYEDTEARYDRRPSAWIVPQGDWGAGRVELLQFHTVDETNDNVVAYWVPDKLPAAGLPIELGYEIRWQGDESTRPPAGFVLQSRRGRSWHTPRGDELQFNVDFVGQALGALPEGSAVDAVVSAGDNARVLFAEAYRHPVLPGWRMTLKVERKTPSQPVELRAFLRQGDQTLTETWSYAVPPE